MTIHHGSSARLAQKILPPAHDAHARVSTIPPLPMLCAERMASAEAAAIVFVRLADRVAARIAARAVASTTTASRTTTVRT